MAHARPKNSRDWVKRHLNDPYVKRSQEEGYRSRAVYKLSEIDANEKLLKPGMTVVDLGSAPGGWSQWSIKKVGAKGKVVAIDLLPMEAVQGVHFIQADFSLDEGLAAVVDAIGGEGTKVDLVISDMAPNLTGIVITDQARLFTLGEMAMEFAVKFLKPNGVFLVKVFQGAGFEPYVKTLRQHFKAVAAKKPDASRDESRETYLLARDLKNPSS
ncbi:MAG: RlmE family RNA methyltransferase [Betaproteobacteria bacterium]|nr:RlmE family RNA methyltransferase [Betaproteobacteria bacterium]